MTDNRIAITGISVKMPGCDNYQELEAKLYQPQAYTNRPIEGQRLEDIRQLYPGFEAVPMAYLDRVDLFDPAFFGISRGEANRMRPEQRLIMEQAVQCILNAGKSPEQMRGSNTGIFLTKADSQFKLLFDGSSKSSMAEISQSMDAARTAYELDLRGPALVIDTTCSSSLVAIHTAIQNLQDGTCEQALVGACSIWVLPAGSEKSSPILSQTLACKAFDAEANGTMFGEGALMIMLKPLQQAEADGDPVHAVIKGTAINHGGARIANITSPSPEAQAEVITRAWQKAGIYADQLAYIESHGTGTVLGDPIEIKGIRQAMDQRPGEEAAKISIGAIKSQFGHLDGAAGLAGLIKLIIAGKKGSIPPLVNFSRLNPNTGDSTGLDFPTGTQDWPQGKTHAAISSFGVSGTNAHVVLSLQQGEVNPKEETTAQLLVLQGATPALIQEQKDYLARAIQEGHSLAALCATVNQSLPAAAYREVIAASDSAQLLSRLQSAAAPVSSPEKQQEAHCFISPDAAIDNAQFQQLAAAFLPLQQKHTALQEHLAVASDLTGFDEFCRLCSYAHWLQDLGMGRFRFIVGGIGKLVAAYSNEKLSPQAFAERLKNLDKDFNKAKFEAFLSMLPADSLGIHIGTRGNMLSSLQHHAGSKKMICGDDLLEQTAAFLPHLARLSPGAIYGAGFQAVPLLMPVFNRQRCWPAVAPQPVQEGASAPAQAKGETVQLQAAALPATSPEEITEEILRIWKEVLDIEEVLSPEADFFELGGTSLMGLDVQDELTKKYQITLVYEDVFEYPTALALGQRVWEIINQAQEARQQEGQGAIAPTDAVGREKAYTDLQEEIAGSTAQLRNPGKVVLTGATGYLGIYLLHYLLHRTEATIYCVTRGKEGKTGKERLTENYKYHFGGKKPDYSRIELIEADLNAESLPPLANVDTVYHAAALVHHFSKRDLSQEANVALTSKLIDWATDNRAVRFCHMSTSAVAGAGTAVVKDYAYYEYDGNIGQHFNGSVYPETKFIAEELLRKKATAIDLQIFRIANISGHSETGIFQQNVAENSIVLFLRDLAGFGIYPSFMAAKPANINPVDKVAQAVVKLSLIQDSPLTAYHINDPETITFGQIAEAMRKTGISLQEVHEDELKDKAGALLDSGNEAFPMLNILRNRRENKHGKIQFATAATSMILSKLGFEWAYDKQAFLQTFLRQQIDNKFIKSPQQAEKP